eukprot:TRINITY_DN30045_c0_g1_i1.p1 TRINITY_DN30045_c0_g1~~TRINITY_DN30045_c0_g1_i1.p1  ORF type:complete len:874 (-),score=165.01 TRINITY_DN30045_c0_g1_i1:31-2652(-)
MACAAFALDTSYEPGPKICEGGSGVFLPLGGEAELGWPRWLRGCLYGAGLVYCFFGVSILADVFMIAIETITSKKKQVLDKATGRVYTKYVWNATVANLTLMALGSSAPEILLSVIELFGQNFYAGELGPSTIVGSAAFNLLIISAICIYSIPSTEIRLIKDVGVYFVTASFSIFAYVWLVIILVYTTPDKVDIFEAVLTLLFFPALAVIAFLADKGFFRTGSGTDRQVAAAEMTKDELAEMIRKVRLEYHYVELDEATVMALVERKTAGNKSRAMYRISMSRPHLRKSSSSLGTSSTGLSKVAVAKKSWANVRATINNKRNSMAHVVTELLSKRRNNKKGIKIQKVKMDRKLTKDLAPEDADRPIVAVEFSAGAYATLEGAGYVEVAVVRHEEKPTSTVSVHYATKDGTAQGGDDYEHMEGELTFPPGIMKRVIRIPIIDDEAWESLEEFYVELSDPCLVGLDVDEPIPLCRLGENKTCCVTIIDDDDPGVLKFAVDLVGVPASEEDELQEIRIRRTHGSRGEISVLVRSEDHSAVAPMDYEEVDTRVTLADGEMDAVVQVLIKAAGRYEGKEQFRLVLSDPEGCRLEGEQSEVFCWVEIRPDESAQKTLDRLAGALAINWDKAQIGKDGYLEQFLNALFIDGSLKGMARSSWKDWPAHFGLMPWNLMSALIPPPVVLNGWATFVLALALIGFVTAFIGDLASLFGCVLGIPDQITAITFVALGTSMPDTFASMTAAEQDPYADACVGNVTGSNSVNVFLGLGLPWTIGAIVWALRSPDSTWCGRYGSNEYVMTHYPEGGFIVEAGSLSFSVVVYTATAVVALALLLVRRVAVGGELGGNGPFKVASSSILVLLWIGYICATYLQRMLSTDA